jgi:hypothetical protein
MKGWSMFSRMRRSLSVCSYCFFFSTCSFFSAFIA